MGVALSVVASMARRSSLLSFKVYVAVTLRLPGKPCSANKSCLKRGRDQLLTKTADFRHSFDIRRVFKHSQ